MTEAETIEEFHETPSIDESQEVLNSEKITLTTDFRLILHTATGQGLFSGEWAAGKMGLRQFGRYVQTLSEAFEKGDPYAEWQLLKIYDAIQALKTKLHEQETQLRKQTLSLRGIQVKAFRNPKPLVVSLNSAHILVLMSAHLITQTDYLVRQILTIKQLGIVPLIQMRAQAFCEEIQNIFTLTQAWEQSNITRQEILENNKKTQRLEKKYGTIPDEIMQQKISLAFLNIEE